MIGKQRPSKTVHCLNLMAEVVAVKVMWHPASHICPTENNEWEARSGTMCAFRARGGRLERSSLASWVERMIVPFGLRMMSGVIVGWQLMTGRLVVQKVAVLLLSAMSELVLLGGPGAVGIISLKQVLVELEFNEFNVGAQGSPHCHLFNCQGQPPDMIQWLSPSRLSAVVAYL